MLTNYPDLQLLLLKNDPLAKMDILIPHDRVGISTQCCVPRSTSCKHVM